MPSYRYAILSVHTDGPPVLLRGLTLHNSTLGPAIMIEGGSVEIDRCTLTHNPYGALQSSGGDVVVAETAFISNGASDVNGGAVQVAGGHLALSQSIFESNVARDGGAVHMSGQGNYWLSEATFFSNEATRHGGAIFASDAHVQLARKTLLEGNVASLSSSSSLFVTSNALVTYILPAPAAHWIGAPIERDGQTVWELVDPFDQDLPFKCPAGVVASADEQEAAMKSPTCAGACPTGSYCTAGTQQPQNCTRGHWCPVGAPSPIPCSTGTYNPEEGSGSESACLVCSSGTYCLPGSAEEAQCAPGTYNDQEGQVRCTNCAAGTFQGSYGATACEACTAGNFCPTASFAERPCLPGTYSDRLSLRSADECDVCPLGSSCGTGSTHPTPCAPATFASVEGSPVCPKCAAGSFQHAIGQSACKVCKPGYYCEEGATTEVPCPGGTSSNVTGATSIDVCTPVTVGFWAPLGSALPEPCPASGFYCPGAANDEKHGGSKPVIASVGSSIVMEEIETVEKELTLDISCADYNETATIHGLAAAYGVDPQLISLAEPAECITTRRARSRRVRDRMLSSGITVTMEIASTGTSAAALMSTVEAVPATSLSAALSSALGTNLTLLSVSSAWTATSLIPTQSSCPKGYWCTAGLQVACKEGFYNDLLDQTDQRSCKACPENAITNGAASTSIDDCVCKGGFISAPSENQTFACLCPAGTGLLGISGAQSCLACTLGSFKSLDGNEKCNDCESGRTTMETGSLTQGACVCVKGLFLDVDGECKECPLIKTECPAKGTTVDSLPIMPGYWRALNTTDVIHQCYTPEFCPNSNGSACQLGHEGPFCEVCIAGYYKAAVGGCTVCGGSWVRLEVLLPVAAFAAVALIGTVYACRRQRRRMSKEAVQSQLETLDETMGMGGALQAMHGYVRQMTRSRSMTRHLRRSSRGKTGEEDTPRNSSPMVKARILISLVQVLNGIGISFNLRWPPCFERMLGALSVVELNFLSIVPLSCSYPITFHGTLIAYTAVPLMLVLSIILVSSIIECVTTYPARVALARSVKEMKATGKRPSKDEMEKMVSATDATQLREQRNALIFLILFLVFPGCVAKVCQTSQCISLPEANARYLRLDFAIDCDSSSHQTVMWGYSMPMVLVYPLGVPLLLSAILWRSRARLRHWRNRERQAAAFAVLRNSAVHGAAERSTTTRAERKTVADIISESSEDPLLPSYVRRAIFGYRLETAWFEVFEMLRKVALVGVAVFFEPGSSLQVAYGLLVTFVAYGVYSSVKPYADRGDGMLAQVAQVQVFLALVLASARSTNDGSDGAWLTAIDVALVFSLAAGTGLAIFLQVWPVLQANCTWIRRACAKAVHAGGGDVQSQSNTDNHAAGMEEISIDELPVDPSALDADNDQTTIEIRKDVHGKMGEPANGDAPTSGRELLTSTAVDAAARTRMASGEEKASATRKKEALRPKDDLLLLQAVRLDPGSVADVALPAGELGHGTATGEGPGPGALSGVACAGPGPMGAGRVSPPSRSGSETEWTDPTHSGRESPPKQARAAVSGCQGSDREASPNAMDAIVSPTGLFSPSKSASPSRPTLAGISGISEQEKSASIKGLEKMQTPVPDDSQAAGVFPQLLEVTEDTGDVTGGRPNARRSGIVWHGSFDVCKGSDSHTFDGSFRIASPVLLSLHRSSTCILSPLLTSPCLSSPLLASPRLSSPPPPLEPRVCSPTQTPTCSPTGRTFL